jgi:hypothetical protein
MQKNMVWVEVMSRGKTELYCGSNGRNRVINGGKLKDLNKVMGLKI